MLESSGHDARLGSRLVRWYLCLVAFGLPFLFGCQVMATENANFPNDLLVWLLLGFTPAAPSFLAPLLSGLGLLLTLAVYPRLRIGDGSLLWGVVWFAPFLAGLVGGVVTTELDYGLNWLLHFWGAATYGLSVWWASRHDGELLQSWCLSVGLGAVLLCLYGYYQRFGGLAAHLEEMKAQHLAEYGQPLPERVAQKLMQLRVNSFFSDPNVFAAHLLVTLPPLFLCLLGRRGGKLSGGRLCGVVVAVSLGLLMLYFTGSRGGLIGLMVGACVGLWTLPWLQRQRWKWCLPLLAVLFAVGVWWYSSASLKAGQVSTASVRFEYYRVAWEMFMESPMTGKGLGEFFPYFVRMKSLGAEMTRDPHSFFMGALAQCGVLGGLAVLLVLSFPFVQALQRTRWRGPQEDRAADSWGLRQILPLAGLAGWCIHSFFQFNELIPGTVYLLPVLPLVVLEGRGRASHEVSRGCRIGAISVAGLAGLLAMVWSALKIPCEYRLQSISEEMHFMRKDMLALNSGVGLGDAESQLMRLEARQSKIKRDLFLLCQEMRLAPAPSNLLLQLLREEVLQARPDAGLSEENRKMLMGAAQKLWRVTPHRSNSCNELAWAYLACGEEEKARQMLRQAREWYPEDGLAYLLEAVPPQDFGALRLVEGLKGKLVRAGDGTMQVEVSECPEERRQAVRDLLSACKAFTFVVVEED